MSGKLLSQRLAKRHELPEAFARKLLLDALLEIESMVAETGRCQIRGFGTFKLKTSAAKRTHDYQTRKMIDVPAKTRMVFAHSQDRAQSLSKDLGRL